MEGRTACRSCWATAMGPSRRHGASVLVPVPYTSRWATSMVIGYRIWRWLPTMTSPFRCCRELATANLGSTTVSVLLGNGDGTFQAPQNFGAGYGPAFTAVADFNGDGKLDLAVANYYDTTVSVMINSS